MTRRALQANVGAALITCDDATLLFAKWKEDKTPLLFRENSSLHKVAMLGAIESADTYSVRFHVQYFGYIDVQLSPDITFEYFDPASQRNTPNDTAGMGDSPDLPATGAGVMASTSTGDTFLFLEILTD